MRLLFPGSFDPLTRGHLDIIQRASAICDELRILVTYNPHKKAMFSPEMRMTLIKESIAQAEIPGTISVDSHTGLVVDYAQDHGFTTLVKGLRTPADYAYEEPMALINKKIGGIDSIFLISEPQWAYVSSSHVKELQSYGGPVEDFVPEPVLRALLALREN